MTHRFTATALASTMMLAWTPGLTADAQAQSIEERLERLATSLDERRVSLNIPGMAIAVVKDDEVIMARGFGVTDIEDNTPVTAETLFAVGSTTKAFAATIIGQLVDEGRMGWDDVASDHVPYFNWTPRTDGDDDTVTIRDLLSHRHGFTRMGLLWAANAVEPEEVLRTASNAEPWADFRTSFNYCNIGYLAAGVASAAVEDTDWDSQVAARLFGPLGMSDANTSIEVMQADPRASLGYVWDDEEEVWEQLPMRSIAACSPAGAINAHVLDMARWVRLQLNKGTLDGQRIVSEDAIAETWTPAIEIAPGLSYGLGWMIHEGDRYIVEHGGNIDGFAAQVGLAPNDGVGYVLLMNVTASGLQQESLSLVFDTLLEEISEPAAANGEDLTEYVGTYLGAAGVIEGQEIDVRIENGQLGVDIPGQMLYLLGPPDDDGRRPFAVTDQVKVSFPRNDAGEVMSMILHEPSSNIESFRAGMPIVPEVDEDDVAPFLGQYKDDEAGMTVEVIIHRGRLSVDVPGQMKFDLHLPDDDGWWIVRAVDGMAVRFDDDVAGRAPAMSFRQGPMERSLARVDADDAVVLPTVEELMTLRRSADQMAQLRAHGTVRLSGTIRFVHSGVEGTIELIFRADDAIRVDMDIQPFGSISQSLYGDAAWSDTSFHGFEEMSPREIDEFRKGHPAMLIDDWRNIWDDVRVLRVEGEGDDRRLIVKMSGGEADPTTATVDPETGDLVEMESVVTVPGLAQLNQTTRLKRVLEINGLRLPMLIETENQANGRIEMIFDTVETGVEVDDSIFQLTASE